MVTLGDSWKKERVAENRIKHVGHERKEWTYDDLYKTRRLCDGKSVPAIPVKTTTLQAGNDMTLMTSHTGLLG